MMVRWLPVDIRSAALPAPQRSAVAPFALASALAEGCGRDASCEEWVCDEDQ